MRNLILTGFMGTGKTTVGRLTADALGLPFVDTDDAIVARTGLSIPEIFVQQGEAAFRQIERTVCLELAADSGRVIATGGGALIDAGLRAQVADGNLLVCLTTAPHVLRRRLADPDGRPLARDWEALYAQRQAAYTAIPQQIDTTDRPPERVAEELARLWAASQSR